MAGTECAETGYADCRPPKRYDSQHANTRWGFRASGSDHTDSRAGQYQFPTGDRTHGAFPDTGVHWPDRPERR